MEEDALGQRKPASLTVLGVDPGSRCLGWGVVRENSGVLSLVDCGTIRPKGDSFSRRLGDLFLGLSLVLRRYSPAEAAIESVFSHRNVLTALKLGQARGVAVAACAANGVPVTDYEPALVKKSLVGAGRAEKAQVSFMVGRLLGRKPDWSADAGDALGCAVCHLNMRRLLRLTAAGM
ncbi:MAG: crossover junction endodeoxyribonuclease RuvC [Desulfovibrio sp.]|jgi:crossover junction endodeoxyribonuclease RuvC|nr:crossover junction endodeoxyribonuclease RuvC [Desulfovibrio sp.]